MILKRMINDNTTEIQSVEPNKADNRDLLGCPLRMWESKAIVQDLLS
jgi:hypothetical protein